MLRTIRAVIALSMLLAAAMTAAQTGPQGLPMPSGPVVLTVTGQIATRNTDDAAVFDLAMLEAMGAETIRTSTIWTTGVQEFTGVPLHRLLERLGVTEGRLIARAINDYAAELPMTDAVPGGAMIAFHRNGSPMSVREKGPLWIVYPYDAQESYRSETHFARSVWQLEQIDVRP